MRARRRSPSTGARPSSRTAAAADWDSSRRGGGALPFPSSDRATASSPNRSSSGSVQGVSGVFVGRGVLRNPWILAQAQDLLEGRPARHVSLRGARSVPARLHRAAAERAGARGRRVSDMWRRAGDAWSSLARTSAQTSRAAPFRVDRWVINKLRASVLLVHEGLDGGISPAHICELRPRHWANCAP